MSKAVVYMGAELTLDEDGLRLGEWEGDDDVTHVTIADGVTEIKTFAFQVCKGLTNLSFLTHHDRRYASSPITTVGMCAFAGSGIVFLQGMERVKKIATGAFCKCEDLRTMEGLGCEEMGEYCFAECTLLQSMKGWPASMTVIPATATSHT
jgi:hypothetical protein